MELSKSLLEAMRDYVKQYPRISDLDLHIDQTDSEPVNFSVETAGLTLVSEDVCGNETWQYNSLLHSREYTADDMQRLDASEFTEAFVFWIRFQNKEQNFPETGEDIEPQSITADNGLLLALDENGDRGLYQIQIHFTFTIINDDF